MTCQEKKAYLLQYRSSLLEERRLADELAQWRARAENSTARYSAEAGGGGDGRSLEHAAEHILQVVEELERQRTELAQLRLEIGAAINTVSDARLRELLMLRYIDGRTWEQVAETMGLSYQWVCRLHSIAMGKLRVDRN